MTLYVNLAELLGTRIEQGFYRPGDRLPSVRALSVEHGVSLSTVQQAYRVLEDNGLAMPKPKSGYFVPVGRDLPALPAVGRPAQRPKRRTPAITPARTTLPEAPATMALATSPE